VRGSSIQKVLDQAVASAALGLAGAGVLCVIAMMVVVTYEVVSRYLLNSPTMWSDEISSYLLIAIVFLGLAQNLRRGDHIRIDIITEKVSARVRAWLELFAYAVGLVFSVLLTIGVWIRFYNFWMRHTLSDSPLMTPLWIPMFPVLLGAAIFALAMLSGLVTRVRSGSGGARSDPVAPPDA
jgi:C4-dicarboxylate transporter, DctQ subunit